jgi:hypothetical protein
MHVQISLPWERSDDSAYATEAVPSGTAASYLVSLVLLLRSPLGWLPRFGVELKARLGT